MSNDSRPLHPNLAPKVDNPLGGYGEEVSAIRTAMDGALARINADQRLSPVGRREEAAKVRTAAEQQVKEIQQRAATDLEGREAALRRDLAKQRREQAEALQGTLGPVVFADVMRRRLEAMKPEEVLAAWRDAREIEDNLTTALIESFGALLHPSLRELVPAKQVELEAKLQAVQHGRQRMADSSSEVSLYRREALAQRFNIKGGPAMPDPAAAPPLERQAQAA